MTRTSKVPFALIGRCLLIVWVFILTCLVLDNLGRINKISENLHTANDNNQQVEILDRKLTALSEQIQSLQENISRLQNADQANQDKNQQAIDAIYKHLGQYMQLADSVVILERLQQLQEDVQKLQEAATTKAAQSVSANNSAKPVPANRPNTIPPFKVLGLELRGGETLLTVIPTGKDSIVSVQLLRTGQTIGNWTLQAINEREAVFKAGSQAHRISIPQ